MKIVDYVVIILFVLGLIVLWFFKQCSLDVYFIVFGLGVAVVCGIALFRANRKLEKKDKMNK